ncbi:MAG: phosphoenolpyruvate--protein phosphotransferase [Ardenticatenaceae bacterium]|nr:phosphoenolpyruvate--protein phosphotransferase [Ardenticatenaceae bacterium]
MVGLLLVSHSARLAAGVRELAQQMAPGVPIAAAGGTAEGEIGTSLELILDGLTQADTGDGVVVLMDLGSAVMTTEMALELLDEEQRGRVQLSNAPLVEGALAAATMAAGGAGLTTVLAAADEARRMQKVEEAPAEAPPAAPEAAPAEERRLTIANPLGLHARPAAQLVQTLSRYDADVRLRNLARPASAVSGRSLVGLLGLGAQEGHTLAASASGREAEGALDALAGLVATGFGEMEGLPPAATPPPQEGAPVPAGRPGELYGIPAAPGIAVGPAFLLEAAELQVPETLADDPAAELARLEAALTAARRELVELERQTATTAGQNEAAIFAAQRLLLEDPALQETARERIERDRENAAAAWQAATRAEAETLRAVDNPLIAGRAADLLDVGRRVVRQLVEAVEEPAVPAGAVVLAGEIAPSEAAALNRAGVAGIATAAGGPTSHAAILARALGVPAIVGLGPALHSIAAATTLVLDGEQGLLLVAPAGEVVARYMAEAAAAHAAQESARAAAQAPAQTADGRRIVVAANVASVEEARAAVANGAEGVGLLRTEFLYLDRLDLPSEDEHTAALRAIFEALEGRPVIVRTLDVGGDKPVPALDLDPVINSFLGVRGLRLSLRRPDLFRQQLRAILRAAVGHHVSVMFPMVTTAEEVRAARAHLAAVEQTLQAEGVAYGRLEEVGIMVEVPAAALAADLLAVEVDFFSVGSNDLVQYTMAAERTNAAVAGLYRPNHPAILRLLAQVVDGAHARGRWVGICGEMAGTPTLTPIFVGLGIDELSMAPASIPPVKAAVRALTSDAARASAGRALAGSTGG